MLSLVASVLLWSSKEGRTFGALIWYWLFLEKGEKLWRTSYLGSGGPGCGSVQRVHLWRAVLGLWCWREKRGGLCSMQKPKAAPCLRALLGVPASGSPLPFPTFRALGADFTRHPEPVWFDSTFCLISVWSLSQEYYCWVRSPSKPCLRWPTFPLSGKGTVCTCVYNWPGKKEALIFDLTFFPL